MCDDGRLSIDDGHSCSDDITSKIRKILDLGATARLDTSFILIACLLYLQFSVA